MELPVPVLQVNPALINLRKGLNYKLVERLYETTLEKFKDDIAGRRYGGSDVGGDCFCGEHTELGARSVKRNLEH